MCDKCKDTNCILNGNVVVAGRKYFVDLRLDLDEEDFPNIDIELVDEEKNQGDWTKSVGINFCPFCGRHLLENK